MMSMFFSVNGTDMQMRTHRSVLYDIYVLVAFLLQLLSDCFIPHSEIVGKKLSYICYILFGQ